MTCAIWEERVALFAGGDLGAAEAAAVERHLSQCAACSALAADLRWELDALRQAHAEPLAAGHYAAVRGRVLAELAKPTPQRVSWPWAWAAALAVAAAAAVLVLVMVRPAAIPAPPLPRLVAVTPMVERPVPGERVRQARKLVRPTHAEPPGLPAIEQQKPVVAEVASPTPPAAEDSPVRMVQLATDDPNVVIYWLFEEKGEER